MLNSDKDCVQCACATAPLTTSARTQPSRRTMVNEHYTHTSIGEPIECRFFLAISECVCVCLLHHCSIHFLNVFGARVQSRQKPQKCYRQKRQRFTTTTAHLL